LSLPPLTDIVAHHCICGRELAGPYRQWGLAPSPCSHSVLRGSRCFV